MKLDYACLYAGFCWRQRVNGIFKTGMTEKKTPAQRFSKLRRDEHFEGLKYIVMKNVSHAEVLYVESYVRLMMSKVPGLSNIKNDHYTYTIIKGEKYNQANTLADLAMCFAKQACLEIGVKYEEGKKKYKR